LVTGASCQSITGIINNGSNTMTPTKFFNALELWNARRVQVESAQQCHDDKILLACTVQKRIDTINDKFEQDLAEL
jgi:hypothetical protein